MKKLNSLIFMILLLVSTNIFVSYAAETNYVLDNKSEERYSVYGIEDETKRFNICIDTEDETGEFAIVYFENPDYVYEFLFNLNDINSDTSAIRWEDVEAFCISNNNQWKEIYVEDALEKDDSTEIPSQKLSIDFNISILIGSLLIFIVLGFVIGFYIKNKS